MPGTIAIDLKLQNKAFIIWPTLSNYITSNIMQFMLFWCSLYSDISGCSHVTSEPIVESFYNQYLNPHMKDLHSSGGHEMTSNVASCL